MRTWSSPDEYKLTLTSSLYFFCCGISELDSSHLSSIICIFNLTRRTLTCDMSDEIRCVFLVQTVSVTSSCHLVRNVFKYKVVVGSADVVVVFNSSDILSWLFIIFNLSIILSDVFLHSTRTQTAQTRSIKNKWFVWSNSSFDMFIRRMIPPSPSLYTVWGSESVNPALTELTCRVVRTCWTLEVFDMKNMCESHPVSEGSAIHWIQTLFHLQGRLQTIIRCLKEGRRDRGLSVKEPDVVYLHKRFLSSYFNDAESCFPRAAAPISLPVFKDVKQRVTLELIEAFQ